MPLIILATMIVLSVLYFNDVGFVTVLSFWGAYLLGFALVLVPTIAAFAFIYQALVAAAFYLTARSSV